MRPHLPKSASLATAVAARTRNYPRDLQGGAAATRAAPWFPVVARHVSFIQHGVCHTSSSSGVRRRQRLGLCVCARI